MLNEVFNQNQLMSQYQQFKSNPIMFLTQRNISIPQQYVNNPEGAVHYLLNNGLMSQEMYNQIAQMASNLGLK